MPYKDKDKQKEYIKKWKKENPKKYDIQRNRHNQKKFIEFSNKLISMSESDRIIYLSTFHGRTRNIILKYLPDNLRIKYKDIFKKRQKERNKQSTKESHQKRKEIGTNFLIQYKKSHPCTYCGESNSLKLSFHYIDGNTKLRFKNKSGITMLDVATEYNIEILKEEINKCDVVCRNCLHIIHYKNRKEDMFRKYKKLWDKKSKSKQEWKRLYKIKYQILVAIYKETLNCIKCNENRSCALIFHHVDYRAKKKEIIHLDTIYSINNELNKCICLCHNCHEEYHQTYGKEFANIEDMKKYLGISPTMLSVDIRDYEEQFQTELK